MCVSCLFFISVVCKKNIKIPKKDKKYKNTKKYVMMYVYVRYLYVNIYVCKCVYYLKALCVKKIKTQKK